jgi:hypothetical protein
MPNNRIYFATHQVSLKPDVLSTGYKAVHGLQSLGMTTNFNLSQVFELGQLSLYENIEDLPDVEITLTKVLDGYPPVYVLATMDGADPSLAGRSAASCKVAVGIFPDTNTSAQGDPAQEVMSSGMFTSSLAYNFPLDDNFSEDITLVGNNRVWRNDPRYTGAYSVTQFAGAFGSLDSPIGLGGVNRRENLRVTPIVVSGGLDTNGALKDPDCTVLPPDVFGISSSGVNNIGSAERARLSSITVSTDFGRDEINELGRRGPYTRYVNFPVEVTCEVVVTATSGDLISAVEHGIYSPAGGSVVCLDSGNLKDRTIRIATCEGLRLYLGKKNKLSSVSYGGGDAGGGNVEITYSFSNFNDLTVMHSGDPSPDGDFAWATRASGLGCGSSD